LIWQINNFEILRILLSHGSSKNVESHIKISLVHLTMICHFCLWFEILNQVSVHC